MASSRIIVSLLLTTVVGCGGSSSTPTSPSPPPLPVVQVTVAPNPLQATREGFRGNIPIYEIAAQVTFRETVGAAGQVTQVTATIVRAPSGATSGGSLEVNLGFAAFGTVTDSYTQQFDLTGDVQRVAWRFSAVGMDSSGRTFQVAAIEVPISFPAPPPPPPPAPSAGPLIYLFGGREYQTFLGCFTCSQFDTRSIHNQFGPYGSRFSSTSIWNHFSDFGSRFSLNSACNEFATNPPILVDDRLTRFYGELTLNRFRPYAIADPAIVSWLRVTVCER